MSRIARLVAIMVVGGAICLAAPAAVSARSAGPGNSLPKNPSKHTTPAAPSTHTKPTKVNNPKTPAKPHARARHRAESTGPSRAEHRVQTSRGAHPRTGRAAGTTASNAVTKNAAKRAVSTAQPSTAVLNPAVIRAVLTGRTTSGVATQSQSRWVRIASQRSGNPSISPAVTINSIITGKPDTGAFAPRTPATALPPVPAAPGTNTSATGRAAVVSPPAQSGQSGSQAAPSLPAAQPVKPRGNGTSAATNVPYSATRSIASRESLSLLAVVGLFGVAVTVMVVGAGYRGRSKSV